MTRKISGRVLKTISDLGADPENPRAIEPENLAGLAYSMEEFGDLSGITFNLKTGQLVCGHQRIRSLSETFGPLEIFQKDQKAWIAPPGENVFPIRLVDWELPKQRAANIAANNPHLSGHFTKALQPQLDEIRSRSDGMFQSLRLHGLMIKKDRQGLTDPNDIPALPQEAKTKLGDIWLLGNHRLLCGDSGNQAGIERLMGKERAGLMNTDPPYGVAYANEARPNPGVAKPRVAKPRVANDTLSDKNLQDFLENVFGLAAKHALKPKAAWYLWHAHLTQGYFAAAAAAAAANVVLHRQIIWVKPVLLLGRGHYHWKHEPAFMGWIEGQQPPDYGLGNGERTQTTIWEINSVSHADRKEFNHATPKPVEIFSIPMVKHLKPGEIAFEPFAGSGPQFIAAEQNGMRCFGIEIDPIFCDVIVARWERFTGKKGVLDGR